MAKSVGFHNPEFEDGVEFDVSGLLIPNGGSIELSEEQELAFFSRTQQTVEDFFQGSKQITVSGTTELSSEVREIHTGVGISDRPAPDMDSTAVPANSVEAFDTDDDELDNDDEPGGDG